MLEALGTNFAAKGLFLRVDSHVRFQAEMVSESFSAHIAAEVFLPRVDFGL